MSWTALNARIMASVHLSAWEIAKPFDTHVLPDMLATKYCYNKSLVSRLKIWQVRYRLV